MAALVRLKALTPLLAVALLTGCAVVGQSSPTAPVPAASPQAAPAAPQPPATSSSPATPSTRPSVSPSVTPSAPPSPTPTPTPTPASPEKDTRKGSALDEPYVAGGVAVISKAHPISRRYQRKDPARYGLERDVAEALATMTAAAKKDGVTIRVRSGYRSYAEQDRILKRKIVEYGDEKLARRYNAEPGKSEHQTGLAVDLWDGVTWGLGVRNTKVGRWLWKHAREYGFILRYPPGKEKITGYAYEPWHFRYIGVERSLDFKANSSLTLEEYLGLA